MKGKTRINFWCPKDLLKDFDKAAKQARRDRTFVLVEAMRLYTGILEGSIVADIITDRLKRQKEGAI
jgi:hypothetical protein